MAAAASVKPLPSAGPARQILQEKGQFWTSDWVAEAMTAYALGRGATRIFDPAVGAGVFYRAARTVTQGAGRPLSFVGMEIDPAALAEAHASGLSDTDLADVRVGDFALTPPLATFPAIVANPPYIRHHRISPELKASLRTFARKLIGVTLDGRAGLHVFFLLRALQLLEPGGRLAFILPADTCEGVFAETLWVWITRNFRLDAVVTFSPEATPFPGVDTNAVVVLIQNDPPRERFVWARCREAARHRFREWIESEFQQPDATLEVTSRTIREGLRTGFSRPEQAQEHTGLTFANLASVQRGIATGANEFFFLTAEQVREREIPAEYLRRAVGRTRDVDGEQITGERLLALEAAGRPTYLLCLDKTPAEDLPEPVQRYLLVGEEMGLPVRPLIAQRRPWYKMEVRTPPPFLFAYLGRRCARFIQNQAAVLPLTGFLCIYPHCTDPESLARLWDVLRHPDTVQNLARVGKSYGSGAIKVEPRSLERLPISDHLADVKGLTPRRNGAQMPFVFYETKCDYPLIVIAEDLT